MDSVDLKQGINLLTSEILLPPFFKTEYNIRYMIKNIYIYDQPK